MDNKKRTMLNSLLQATPKAFNLPDHQLAEMVQIKNGTLPVVRGANQKLEEWVSDHVEDVEALFKKNGIILFRDFIVPDVQSFEAFTAKLSNDKLDYSEPSTPRKKVSDKVYTSTEYNANYSINQHNENSYASQWPKRIWFYCKKPAANGGQTPISNSADVYNRLSTHTKSKFTREGVMYVRNFYPELDLKWQDVFNSNDPTAVEEYCKKAGIHFDWVSPDHLRTWQVHPAVLEHPADNSKVWFNQAHLFHRTNLPPEILSHLTKLYGAKNLSRESYYGNGEEIEPEVLEEIRSVYKDCAMEFDWQKGDVLMVDNIRYAHGRNSYAGEREVFVCMSDLMKHRAPETRSDLDTIQIRKTTAKQFIEKMEQPKSFNELKYRFAAVFRILALHDMDTSISGHATFRDPQDSNHFWVNPFGLLADEIEMDNLIKVNKDGTVIHGEHPVNVAGFLIHRAIHDARPDINCIIHTHSPWGTAFSASGLTMKFHDQDSCMFYDNYAIHNEYNGPVINAAEAERLAATLGKKNVLILTNHGLLVCGKTIEEATVLILKLEETLRTNVLLGHLPNTLSIPHDIAIQTKPWIMNPFAFEMEFNALLRSVERNFPTFRNKG